MKKILNVQSVLILTLALLVAISTNLVHAVTAQKMISINAPDQMIGSYMAVLSIGSFISSPFWGKLSDKIGRKYVFAGGALLYLIGSIGFCFDIDPYRIHIWRFISGLASAQNIITMVMLSDVVKPKNYPKIMILFSLCENIGFGIGRFLGGIIGNTNFYITFELQFIMQIVIIVITIFVYKESLKNSIVTKKLSNHSKQLKSGLKNPLLYFAIVVFASYMAKVGYNNMINMYATKALHYSPASTSIYMLAASIVVILTLLIIAPKLNTKFKISNKIFWDLILGGTFLFLGAIINSLLIKVTLSLVYEMFNVMFESAINPYVISRVDDTQKGQYTGYITSFRFAGQMSGALCSGFTFTLNYNMPFIIAGISLILGSIIYFVFRPND